VGAVTTVASKKAIQALVGCEYIACEAAPWPGPCVSMELARRWLRSRTALNWMLLGV